MDMNQKKLAGVGMVVIALAGLAVLVNYSVRMAGNFVAPARSNAPSVPIAAPTTGPAALMPRIVTLPPNLVSGMPQPILLPRWIARPPLEIERRQAESKINAGAPTRIAIESGFEGSLQMPPAIQLSPTHFALSPQTDQWFMFKVHGVAAQTVRFDLSWPESTLRYWSTLNPVYTYATNLSDPAMYAVDQKNEAVIDPKQPTAWNGAALPSTEGQQWHYIPDAWQENVHQFSFVKHFDKDDATIAMRVPVMPSALPQLLQAMAARPSAQVITIGTTPGGLPLLLLKIGNRDESSERTKPCVLVYGGEHASQHDAFLAALGGAEFLLSDRPEAQSLRDRFTFLFIPMMDPDATAAGEHQRILSGFMEDFKTAETIAYANWFQQWANDHKRLDLVFDLDNIQSKDGPNFGCFIMEGAGERGKAGDALFQAILNEASQQGFSVNKKPWMRGWSPDRMGGWVARRYGPLSSAYGLNSQAPDFHLNMQQVKDLGAVFVTSASRFLSSPEGQTLLADIDSRRKDRADRFAKNGPINPGTDAISAEAIISHGEGIGKADGSGQSVESWVP